MSKELEIWQFAAERLKRNESVMLLVVAESSGSSPGRQGFKMIVARDEMAGSVGGGVMEVNLVEQSEIKLQNKRSKFDSEIVEQIHRKNSPDSSGMICSGKQTIIFFRLDSAHLAAILEIINALETYQSKVLRISNSALEVSPNESNKFDFQFRKQSQIDFFYAEKLGSKNKLFIIGGGHCALALSELMSKTDFYITLFDDREDLNTLAKNEFVHEKTIIESYENIGDFIESGANHYVVVMTLGYKFDEIVIRKLIDKNVQIFWRARKQGEDANAARKPRKGRIFKRKTPTTSHANRVAD